jgi:hypothetical protein
MDQNTGFQLFDQLEFIKYTGMCFEFPVIYKSSVVDNITQIHTIYISMPDTYMFICERDLECTEKSYYKDFKLKQQIDNNLQYVEFHRLNTTDKNDINDINENKNIIKFELPSKLSTDNVSRTFYAKVESNTNAHVITFTPEMYKTYFENGAMYDNITHQMLGLSANKLKDDDLKLVLIYNDMVETLKKNRYYSESVVVIQLNTDEVSMKQYKINMLNESLKMTPKIKETDKHASLLFVHKKPMFVKHNLAELIKKKIHADTNNKWYNAFKAKLNMDFYSHYSIIYKINPDDFTSLISLTATSYNIYNRGEDVIRINNLVNLLCTTWYATDYTDWNTTFRLNMSVGDFNIMSTKYYCPLDSSMYFPNYFKSSCYDRNAISYTNSSLCYIKTELLGKILLTKIDYKNKDTNICNMINFDVDKTDFHNVIHPKTRIFIYTMHSSDPNYEFKTAVRKFNNNSNTPPEDRTFNDITGAKFTKYVDIIYTGSDTKKVNLNNLMLSVNSYDFNFSGKFKTHYTNSINPVLFKYTDITNISRKKPKFEFNANIIISFLMDPHSVQMQHISKSILAHMQNNQTKIDDLIMTFVCNDTDNFLHVKDKHSIEPSSNINMQFDNRTVPMSLFKNNIDLIQNNHNMYTILFDPRDLNQFVFLGNEYRKLAYMEIQENQDTGNSEIITVGCNFFNKYIKSLITGETTCENVIQFMSVEDIKDRMNKGTRSSSKDYYDGDINNYTKREKDFREHLENTALYVKKTSTSLVSIITAALGAVKTTANAIVDTIKKGFSIVSGGISGILSYIQEIIITIATFFSKEEPITESKKENAFNIVTSLTNFLTGIYNSLTNLFGNNIKQQEQQEEQKITNEGWISWFKKVFNNFTLTLNNIQSQFSKLTGGISIFGLNPGSHNNNINQTNETDLNRTQTTLGGAGVMEQFKNFFKKAGNALVSVYDILIGTLLLTTSLAIIPLMFLPNIGEEIIFFIINYLKSSKDNAEDNAEDNTEDNAKTAYNTYMSKYKLASNIKTTYKGKTTYNIEGMYDSLMNKFKVKKSDDRIKPFFYTRISGVNGSANIVLHMLLSSLLINTNIKNMFTDVMGYRIIYEQILVESITSIFIWVFSFLFESTDTRDNAYTIPNFILKTTDFVSQKINNLKTYYHTSANTTSDVPQFNSQGISKSDNHIDSNNKSTGNIINNDQSIDNHGLSAVNMPLNAKDGIFTSNSLGENDQTDVNNQTDVKKSYLDTLFENITNFFVCHALKQFMLNIKNSTMSIFNNLSKTKTIEIVKQIFAKINNMIVSIKEYLYPKQSNKNDVRKSLFQRVKDFIIWFKSLFIKKAANKLVSVNMLSDDILNGDILNGGGNSEAVDVSNDVPEFELNNTTANDTNFNNFAPIEENVENGANIKKISWKDTLKMYLKTGIMTLGAGGALFSAGFLYYHYNMLFVTFSALSVTIETVLIVLIGAGFISTKMYYDITQKKMMGGEGEENEIKEENETNKTNKTTGIYEKIINLFTKVLNYVFYVPKKIMEILPKAVSILISPIVNTANNIMIQMSFNIFLYSTLPLLVNDKTFPANKSVDLNAIRTYYSNIWHEIKTYFVKCTNPLIQDKTIKQEFKDWFEFCMDTVCKNILNNLNMTNKELNHKFNEFVDRNPEYTSNYHLAIGYIQLQYNSIYNAQNSGLLNVVKGTQPANKKNFIQLQSLVAIMLTEISRDNIKQIADKISGNNSIQGGKRRYQTKKKRMSKRRRFTKRR